MIGYILATIFGLGGITGLLLLLARGILTASVSHWWKRRLERRDNPQRQPYRRPASPIHGRRWR